MKLQLVAVGTKMPDWVQTGFSEYLRRFPKDMPFELVEIPAGKRGKNADIKRILEKEGEMMLAAAGKNRIVTLDIPGKPWDTPQLAARKASLQPVKQRRNRVGRSPPSPYLTRWCAYWWPRACIGRGALPPTIRTTVSNDDQGRLSSE